MRPLGPSAVLSHGELFIYLFTGPLLKPFVLSL